MALLMIRSAAGATDAIVLAAAKSKANTGLRPPLTAAARDGCRAGERDGGISQHFCEQRNGGRIAFEAQRSRVILPRRHTDQVRVSSFAGRVQSR